MKQTEIWREMARLCRICQRVQEVEAYPLQKGIKTTCLQCVQSVRSYLAIRGKYCMGCSTLKSTAQFHVCNANIEGRARYCKECMKEKRLSSDSEDESSSPSPSPLRTMKREEKSPAMFKRALVERSPLSVSKREEKSPAPFHRPLQIEKSPAPFHRPLQIEKSPTQLLACIFMDMAKLREYEEGQVNLGIKEHLASILLLEQYSVRADINTIDEDTIGDAFDQGIDV